MLVHNAGLYEPLLLTQSTYDICVQPLSKNDFQRPTRRGIQYPNPLPAASSLRGYKFLFLGGCSQNLHANGSTRSGPWAHQTVNDIAHSVAADSHLESTWIRIFNRIRCSVYASSFELLEHEFIQEEDWQMQLLMHLL